MVDFFNALNNASETNFTMAVPVVSYLHAHRVDSGTDHWAQRAHDLLGFPSSSTFKARRPPGWRAFRFGGGVTPAENGRLRIADPEEVRPGTGTPTSGQSSRWGPAQRSAGPRRRRPQSSGWLPSPHVPPTDETAARHGNADLRSAPPAGGGRKVQCCCRPGRRPGSGSPRGFAVRRVAPSGHRATLLSRPCRAAVPGPTGRTARRSAFPCQRAVWESELREELFGLSTSCRELNPFLRP